MNNYNTECKATKQITPNVQVFYNKDCTKYGFCAKIKDYMGERYHQMTLKDKPAYTKYAKVAERWANEWIKQYGDAIIEW